MQRSIKVHCLTSIVAVVVSLVSTSLNAQVLQPSVTGPWLKVAGNPDLGDYTSENQQPVDFAVWQAKDGSWQLWSCIRNTKCGGNTRLFYRWESPDLFQADWRPVGIAMEAQTELGEAAGGLQAPHVVFEDGLYHMFYGDWNSICHATSEDGKSFQRVVQASGHTAIFTEGIEANTRDVMLLKVDGHWNAYYTAFPNDQGMVYVRTSDALLEWSSAEVVAFGGLAGTNRYSAECPHVVFRNQTYYLFRTQHYGANALTTVYNSANPKMFGINQDARYLLTRMAIAAPEIVSDGDQDYLFSLTPGLDGIQVAALSWEPPTEPGKPVFDWTDKTVRSNWISDATEAPVFTISQRSDFLPPQRHFIGTAEKDNEVHDELKCRVRSPEFVIDHNHYWAYLSGGPRKRVHMALIDAESKKEMFRLTPSVHGNRLEPRLIPTDQWLGHKAFIEIVDNDASSWGHINFGGLYYPQSPTSDKPGN